MYRAADLQVYQVSGPKRTSQKRRWIQNAGKMALWGKGNEQTSLYKMIHEGKYVAEVEVEMISTDEGWSLYFSLYDAYKLDDIRKSLKWGDIKSATKLARIYTLIPVSN